MLSLPLCFSLCPPCLAPLCLAPLRCSAERRARSRFRDSTADSETAGERQNSTGQENGREGSQRHTARNSLRSSTGEHSGTTVRGAAGGDGGGESFASDFALRRSTRVMLPRHTRADQSRSRSLLLPSHRSRTRPTQPSPLLSMTANHSSAATTLQQSLVLPDGCEASAEPLLTHKRVVGYFDGCFDVMHSGHYNAFRMARDLCDELIVGVHSSKEIERTKKVKPVQTDEERVRLVGSCKWVDRVVLSKDYSPDYMALLDKFGCAFALHGSDINLNAEGKDPFAEVKKAGRFRTLPRMGTISTSEIITRLLKATSADPHEQKRTEEEEDADSYLLTTDALCKFMNTSRHRPHVPKEGHKVRTRTGGEGREEVRRNRSLTARPCRPPVSLLFPRLFTSRAHGICFIAATFVCCRKRRSSVISCSWAYTKIRPCCLTRVQACPSCPCSSAR